MAVRINVTAVRDCPQHEVRAVMSEVIRIACQGEECTPVGDLLQITEHAGWVWFTTSVWGVSAGDLNRGLCKLARPALQFTTSDGDRWYLTIHGGPLGQVHFLHEFHVHNHDPEPAEDAERQAELEQRDEPPPVDPALAFLEDDPVPGDDRPRTPFDAFAEELIGMGAYIPDEFRASVAGLPYSQAVARYRRWHAEQLLAALTAAGIAHDADAVRAVLLWEGVGEAERGSDLGNLPRLLAVLGLGGDWDEWLRQAEAVPEEGGEEYEPEPLPPPEDHIGPVLVLTEGLTLTPVAGGPVPLPLKEMPLVRFFVEALYVEETAGVVLAVTLPAGFDRSALTPPTEEGAGPVDFTADGFRVGLWNHLHFGRRELRQHLGKRLARLLFHLPDGATLDVAFGKEGQPALVQRYRGPVRDEHWQIAETYPAPTHAVLAEALELARTPVQRKYRARDEAEAEAIIARARLDPHLWDLTVERKGRSVRCRDDHLGRLAMVFFRHRYGGYWDVATFDREAARQREEYLTQQSQMRRAAVEAARRRAAPHDEEVLLRGRAGIYWRSDFTRLDELEQETRTKIDADMTALGFQHIGDLVAKRQRDIVLRLYAAADGQSYGVLMGKRTMYLGYEFFSRFADGTTLTTTTNGAVESRPEVGVYYKTCPGMEVAALFAKHRWGVERFRTHRGTEPVALGGTLLDGATELDAAFARQPAQ